MDTHGTVQGQIFTDGLNRVRVALRPVNFSIWVETSPDVEETPVDYAPTWVQLLASYLLTIMPRRFDHGYFQDWSSTSFPSDYFPSYILTPDHFVYIDGGNGKPGRFALIDEINRTVYEIARPAQAFLYGILERMQIGPVVDGEVFHFHVGVPNDRILHFHAVFGELANVINDLYGIESMTELAVQDTPGRIILRDPTLPPWEEDPDLDPELQPYREVYGTGMNGADDDIEIVSMNIIPDDEAEAIERQLLREQQEDLGAVEPETSADPVNETTDADVLGSMLGHGPSE